MKVRWEEYFRDHSLRVDPAPNSEQDGNDLTNLKHDVQDTLEIGAVQVDAESHESD